MFAARALIASCLCASAALAQSLQPLIVRPPTLPAGKLALTIEGTYSNWATGASAAGLAAPTSVEGETVSLGVDFGATDRVQLGLATALPVHPGAAFGSVLASAAFAAGSDSAIRLDFGFENFGANGDVSTGEFHVNRFFGGIGARILRPLSPMLAFVTGRVDSVQFGHFNNVGDSGIGLYLGSTFYPQLASDFLVVSGGDKDSGTAIGVNLPLGLLIQADPAFAVTVFAGYSADVLIPSGNGGGGTGALHFLPVGLEAVGSPTAAIDIGLRFSLDGFLGQTGGGSDYLVLGQGYFDRRELMLWFRFHTG